VICTAKTRDLSTAFVAALALLCLGAAPALAAPAYEVGLKSDSGTPASAFPVVRHSDERIDYTAQVSNTAPVAPLAAGDTLSCNHGTWTGTVEPEFSYQWLRNGAPISGATSPTYATEAPTDDGKAIQCRVAATNTIADATSSTDFAGAVRVSEALVPGASPALPTPPGAGVAAPGASGPLDGTTARELTCNAGSWGGSPSEYVWQWFRNGSPLGSPTTTPAATASVSLTLTAAEQSPPAAFQCSVAAINAQGGRGAASASLLTATAPNPAAPVSPVDLYIAPPNDSAGTLALEVQLPGGRRTFAYKAVGSGWSCAKVPPTPTERAKALCTREDRLAAGASFPPVVVIATLGADAPDVAFARASVFGGGAAATVTKTLPFILEPAVPFGLTTFTAALKKQDEATDYDLAGGHPFVGLSETAVSVKRALEPEAFSPYFPVEQVRQVVVELPQGVVGNVLALPELCPGIQSGTGADTVVDCPKGSVVGSIDIQLAGLGTLLPIYAIEPEFGTPAQFAFKDPGGNVFTISPRLRAHDGYAVDFVLAPAPEVNFLEAEVELCNFGGIQTSSVFNRCRKPGEVGVNPKPLFTTPTSCTGPLVTRARLNSWEDTTFVAAAPYVGPAMTDCASLPFDPEATFRPTSGQADSPTGMQIELSMPTNGLEGEDKDGNPVADPETEARAQANLKEAKITFPEGMAINPSAAQGLEACSAAQVKLGTNEPISCPESSKVGSIQIKTPLIREALDGDVYVARQGEVEGSLLGLYLVFDSPKNGILIKQASAVTPDPDTGQLTATVKGIPQQPFSKVKMDFPQGDRATLLNPPGCGRYEMKAELVPWSGGPAVTRTTGFDLGEGPGGAGCPSGGLDPKLSAGSQNPLAGQASPFMVRLHREDGSARFSSLNLKLPPGLTAYLRGVPYCPDSTLESISSALGSGQSEIDNPSCPAASQIGSVVAGAGAGPEPFYTATGRAYLAGPYKGAPLSIAVVAPAVAGPLDLGTVVVRNALHLDPETAQVSAVSDPIPTIWHGLLLDIRDIRVRIDRPHFTLNPTSCEESSLSATVGAPGGASASASERFQVGGCERLGFKPRLFTRLYGGIHRGDFPRFRAVYAPREGDANVSDLVLRFPRSEFIEQGHFRTICTRVQYAAGEGFGSQCPKGSIYGHVTATTPLLDQPLSGPVYLRSSSHDLPDVVFALRGQVNAEASVRIDSQKGSLRARVEDAPDVPLTKVVVNMRGGQKGLFVNSRNSCTRRYRVAARAIAHNNRISRQRPLLRNARCAKVKRQRQRGHRRKRVSER
jgi:hypothetical protein